MHHFVGRNQATADNCLLMLLKPEIGAHVQFDLALAHNAGVSLVLVSSEVWSSTLVHSLVHSTVLYQLPKELHSLRQACMGPLHMSGQGSFVCAA